MENKPDNKEWEKHLADIRKAYKLDDEDEGLPTFSEYLKNEFELLKRLYGKVCFFMRKVYGREE